MKTIGVIPARMGSLRFPGKPLAPILGRPMIEHVYRRTALCSSLDAVYVATCDEEIRQAVSGFGGRVIMTSPTHQRASDRVAEAVETLDVDSVLMVQGDEPMVHPQMLETAVTPMLKEPALQCVNLIKRIESDQEFRSPNTVKVVMDCQGDALYFSREPIPTPRLLGFEQIPVFKQTGIILFRRDLLLKYSQLEPTLLEQAESVDMLRLLEHGYKIRFIETELDIHGVDTVKDLELVENLMRRDQLTSQYLE